MARYIIIRLADEAEAEQVAQTLLEELNTDGLRFRVGNVDDVYDAVEYLSEGNYTMGMAITEIEDEE
jgi:hypothetical protein